MSIGNETIDEKQKKSADDNDDDDAYLIDYSTLMTLPKSIILEAIQYAKRKRDEEDKKKEKEEDEYIRLKCIPPWAKSYGGQQAETCVTTGTQYEMEKEVSFQKHSEMFRELKRTSEDIRLLKHKEEEETVETESTISVDKKRESQRRKEEEKQKTEAESEADTGQPEEAEQKILEIETKVEGKTEIVDAEEETETSDAEKGKIMELEQENLIMGGDDLEKISEAEEKPETEAEEKEIAMNEGGMLENELKGEYSEIENELEEESKATHEVEGESPEIETDKEGEEPVTLVGLETETEEETLGEITDTEAKREINEALVSQEMEKSEEAAFRLPSGEEEEKPTSEEAEVTPETLPEKPNKDTTYIKRELGRFLTKALAEIAWKRPGDPVHYLAHRLYHEYKKQQILEEKICAEKILQKERERLMVSDEFQIKSFGYIEKPPKSLDQTNFEAEDESDSDTGDELRSNEEKLIKDTVYHSSVDYEKSDIPADTQIFREENID